MALVLIYQVNLFSAWPPLDYFLTALLIAWLSGFQWVLMCWLMERAGKVKDRLPMFWVAQQTLIHSPQPDTLPSRYHCISMNNQELMLTVQFANRNLNPDWQILPAGCMIPVSHCG